MKYTVPAMSPAPPGADKPSIRIINDGDHLPILDAIKTRWRTRMRPLHREINFSNDPAKALARFAGMKERAVIADDEYREVVETLPSDRVIDQPEPMGRTLN
jgi:hypothetical protein